MDTSLPAAAQAGPGPSPQWRLRRSLRTLVLPAAVELCAFSEEDAARRVLRGLLPLRVSTEAAGPSIHVLLRRRRRGPATKTESSASNHHGPARTRRGSAPKHRPSALGDDLQVRSNGFWVRIDDGWVRITDVQRRITDGQARCTDGEVRSTEFYRGPMEDRDAMGAAGSAPSRQQVPLESTIFPG